MDCFLRNNICQKTELLYVFLCRQTFDCFNSTHKPKKRTTMCFFVVKRLTVLLLPTCQTKDRTMCFFVVKRLTVLILPTSQTKDRTMCFFVLKRLTVSTQKRLNTMSVKFLDQPKPKCLKIKVLSYFMLVMLIG
jgi:hypothetical protein